MVVSGGRGVVSAGGGCVAVVGVSGLLEWGWKGGGVKRKRNKKLERG